MIELFRIVEQKAALASFRAAQNEEHALQLELLIEMTKPKNRYSDWHPLIATPFRYSPPHPHARFRPPYGKNVFYASASEETALYEHAFHFMKQRVHLSMDTETGTRTIFSVDADDKNAARVKKDIHGDAIVNKHDYAASHQFAETNPHLTFIVYPSCRDPRERDNAAIFDIAHLDKYPRWESAIKFFYDNAKKQIAWLDYGLHIRWNQVA